MPDVVVVYGTTTTMSVFLGTNTGTLGIPITVTLPGTGANFVSLSDLNYDGRLDAAITHGSANGTNGVLSVLAGRGTAAFETAVNVTVGSNPIAIQTVDLNRDGKRDLTTANFFGNSLSISLQLP